MFDDPLTWLIGAAVGYFLVTHWDDIVRAVKSFFYDLAEELGIDLNVLINNFRSTIRRVGQNAYRLITRVFLRDRYGRMLNIEPKVEEISFDQIPEHLRNRVANGYDVDATREVRQELINQL